MSLSIIHEEIINIERDYYQAKRKIQEKLHEWPELFSFDDDHQQVRYETEGPLVPDDNSKAPVLILLSNPHPHSVKQGMFLSPNRSGRENPFWETLRGTGFFQQSGRITAETMIKNMYRSLFRFFMAVLLPFPSEDPSHLKDILGSSSYKKMLINGRLAVSSLVKNNNIKHIICFGRLQYDSLSLKGSPDSYTSLLSRGETIRDSIATAAGANIYLTYPTGWRFVNNHKILKFESLKNILSEISRNG